MKDNARKRILVFGDFVVAVCAVWGKRKGPGMVRLAINARLVEFLGEQRLVVTER